MFDLQPLGSSEPGPDYRERTSAPLVLEASFEAVGILLISCVTGGYGVGNFVGKLAAWLFGLDRSSWGDVGGILGGLVGLSLFITLVIAMVSS